MILIAFVQKLWSKTSINKIRIRIRTRIYLLARRNLLWDILRLPSSRRAALGLYVILTLWQGRGANQPPYALLHRSSPRYALRHGRRNTFTYVSCSNAQDILIYSKALIQAILWWNLATIFPAGIEIWPKMWFYRVVTLKGQGLLWMSKRFLSALCHLPISTCEVTSFSVTVE